MNETPDPGLDEAILTLLHEDARRSHESIAEELDYPVETISDRIAALEADGTITQYTVLTDPTKLGYISVAFGISTDPTATDEIAETLAGYENVYKVWILSGRHSVVLHARFRDIADFQAFTNDTLNSIEGIVQYESSIVTRSVLAEGSVILSET